MYENLEHPTLYEIFQKSICSGVFSTVGAHRGGGGNIVTEKFILWTHFFAVSILSLWSFGINFGWLILSFGFEFRVILFFGQLNLPKKCLCVPPGVSGLWIAVVKFYETGTSLHTFCWIFSRSFWCGFFKNTSWKSLGWSLVAFWAVIYSLVF